MDITGMLQSIKNRTPNHTSLFDTMSNDTSLKQHKSGFVNTNYFTIKVAKIREMQLTL